MVPPPERPATPAQPALQGFSPALIPLREFINNNEGVNPSLVNHPTIDPPHELHHAYEDGNDDDDEDGYDDEGEARWEAFCYFMQANFCTQVDDQGLPEYTSPSPTPPLPPAEEHRFPGQLLLGQLLPGQSLPGQLLPGQLLPQLPGEEHPEETGEHELRGAHEGEEGWAETRRVVGQDYNAYLRRVRRDDIWVDGPGAWEEGEEARAEMRIEHPNMAPIQFPLYELTNIEEAGALYDHLLNFVDDGPMGPEPVTVIFDSPPRSPQPDNWGFDAARSTPELASAVRGAQGQPAPAVYHIDRDGRDVDEPIRGAVDQRTDRYVEEEDAERDAVEEAVGYEWHGPDDDPVRDAVKVYRKDDCPFDIQDLVRRLNGTSCPGSMPSQM